MACSASGTVRPSAFAVLSDHQLELGGLQNRGIASGECNELIAPAAEEGIGT
jgi:hypothetical protein